MIQTQQSSRLFFPWISTWRSGSASSPVPKSSEKQFDSVQLGEIGIRGISAETASARWQKDDPTQRTLRESGSGAGVFCRGVRQKLSSELRISQPARGRTSVTYLANGKGRQPFRLSLLDLFGHGGGMHEISKWAAAPEFLGRNFHHAGSRGCPS